eukprot:s152_g5.t1
MLQVAVPTNPTHYGNPSTGCESDEQAVKVQGLSGDFCSPKCDSTGSCPSDVPKGDTATPECALRTTTGDKYCALICQSDSDCGTGSCQKIMGVGLCTYDAAATAEVETMTTQVAVATNPTHYGNPSTGCESDEQAVKVQSTGSCQKIMGVGLHRILPEDHGSWPVHLRRHCNGTSGNYDYRGGCGNQPHPLRQPKHWLRIGSKGDTATPECALRTTTGDKYCALICQSDSDCGTGSCQKIMGVGLCTYDASAAAGLQLLPAQAATSQIVV